MGYSDPISPPPPAVPGPGSLMRCEVVTVNGDGTVDLRNLASRGAFSRVTPPRGAVLALRDRVIVGHVAGDAQRPVILTVEA